MNSSDNYYAAQNSSMQSSASFDNNNINECSEYTSVFESPHYKIINKNQTKNTHESKLASHNNIKEIKLNFNQH